MSSASVTPAQVAGVLAVLMPAGGAVGFFRKKSIPSLLGGSLVGGLYAYASWQLSNAKSPASPLARNGALVAVIASILLLTVMGIRFAKSLKPVPAVLATIAGLATWYFAQEL